MAKETMTTTRLNSITDIFETTLACLLSESLRSLACIPFAKQILGFTLQVYSKTVLVAFFSSAYYIESTTRARI